MMYKIAPVLLLLLGANLISARFPGLNPDAEVPEVDQHCMDCICQASSNCDETAKCHKVVGGGGYLCGPYVVSWAYWYDGGRPGDTGRPEDFQTCLTNRTCAEQAVRGYMRRYGRDCDADDSVDCHDFARIHKLGFDQCSVEDVVYSEYWRKFVLCYGCEPTPLERGATDDENYFDDDDEENDEDENEFDD